MTLQPDLVEVACVRCGTICTAYLKPAVDHEPERWCAESGGPEPALCPECGAELMSDPELEPHVLGAHPGG